MDREDWNRKYDIDAYVWHVEPNQFLGPEVSGLAPGRALDVACGEGRNAVWLAQQGWDVTGVDFSDVGIAKARRLAEDAGVHVHWEVADATEHDFGSQAYDLVIVFYLQLPRAQEGAALARAAQAVAPGGTFLLVAHDRANLTDGHGGPKDPEVLTTVEEVVEALAGFEVVRAEVVERRVDVDGTTKVALDTMVRARRPAEVGAHT